MAIRYKFAILPALKEAGYNSTRLRREKLLGESTGQQLRRGELVSWTNIDRICAMLQCQPGDILEWVPDNEFHIDELPPARESTEKQRVNTAFDAMNPTGQKETARTVEVLAASPIYRRKREPSEEGQEGQKEKPPEGT